MDEELPFLKVYYFVLQNKKMTLCDALVYSIIDSLDIYQNEHCYATNGYIAKTLGISERQVSKSISRLKELDYIRIVSNDGRNRRITTRAR